MPPLTVVVTGATGNQGGTLARVLLEKGHRVHAYVRKPDAPAALDLKRRGAELVAGDLDHPDALERAARGADALFAVSTPYEAGVEVEIRHGIAEADAARAAGVRHLVYSSVANADRKTGIPHFESKYRVEQHIRSLGTPFTIVAPAFFMENLLSPWWLPGLREGKLALALPPSRSLQSVALRDLGRFTALVIENRDRFFGKRLDVASDERTGAEVVEILSRVTGRKIEYIQTPIEQVRASSEDTAAMLEWFDRVGYSVDIPALRRDYPEVGWLTFEQWAKLQDWNVLDAVSAR